MGWGGLGWDRVGWGGLDRIGSNCPIPLDWLVGDTPLANYMLALYGERLKLGADSGLKSMEKKPMHLVAMGSAAASLSPN